MTDNNGRNFQSSPLNILSNQQNPQNEKTNNTNQSNMNFPNSNQNPQENNQPRKPKRKPISQSINEFLRTLGIFVVLIVLLISGLLAYILFQPTSPVSKWIIGNTALKNYFVVNENKDQQTSNLAIKQDENKALTSLLGLNNAQNFKFIEPGDSKTTTQVVQEVLPAVLSLSVKSESNRLGVASDIVAGTGFIVSEDGLVITNKHVIANKCTSNNNNIKIYGAAQNQQAYELDLMSVDPIDDVAILKIKNQNQKFTPVKFGDSNSIPIGAEAIAVGNVLGQLQNSVTKGIVSGLNRTVGGDSEGLVDQCTSSRVSYIDGLIQTDAAINKGNSGGPLFDSTGRLIGMNTLGTSDSQNIGFAISSNLIVADLNSYAKNNIILRPRLGVYTKPITPLIAKESAWLPVDYGEILIGATGENAIAKGSPAEQSGLQAGDIILEFNGTKLVATDQNPSPLRRVILSKQPDDEVELVIRRIIGGDSTNGYKYEEQSRTIKVKLGKVSFDLNQTGNI